MKFLLPLAKFINIRKKPNVFTESKKNNYKPFYVENKKNIITEIKSNKEKFKFFKLTILILTTFLSQLGSEKNSTKILNIPSTNAIEIDAFDLRITQEDVLNEKFLFSEKTTQNSMIEREVQEIEDDEFRYESWRSTQIGLTMGGSLLGMWFTFKGLNRWEKWMRDQEQKDIEKEIKMTGKYINPSSPGIRTTIDPLTGKKFSSDKPSKKKSKKEEED